MAFVYGEDLIVGDGFPSRGGAARGHFLAIHRMASDGKIDGSLHMAGPSTDDGQVGFLHLTICKLLRNRRMGLVILGDNNAAAGLLVESVDDAGAMLFRA